MNRLPDLDLLREMLSYNPESGELRWKVKRTPKTNVGDEAGWVSKEGYTYVMINYTHYAAHRIAWALHYGEDPYPHIVDHKEGVENGNAVSNLRIATDSENALNRRKQSNNTSGHRGVWYEKSRRKWRALLIVRGKRIFLGRYETVEEAIAARLKAEEEYNIFVRE